MQLSRLDIKGFKSFADKITVHFDKGVTGVVGPNGCGKSNIVDAIRWVLGEQKTRNLRSEKMEDVVFNGTKKRKQAQLAEVSMTFQNTKNILPTEYSEVTITRKYFRSGDSEYQLNGVKCRLKDITGLFMDTGIGPDSYSIIELEMVKDILNDTNDARRTLFEEAAGIAKFKKRKKETLGKLKGTLDDLERVEDLLYEIEKQMRSLERQAKKAKQYYELQKDYKELSLILAKMTIQGLLGQEGRLEQQAAKNEDESLAIKTNIAAIESSTEAERAKVLEKERLLKSRQKFLNEFDQSVRQKESEKQIKNERLSLLRDREEGLKHQLERDQERHVELSEKSKSLEATSKDASEAYQRLTGAIEKEKAANEQAKALRESEEKKSQETANQLRQTEQALYEAKKQFEISEVQYQALRSNGGQEEQGGHSSEQHLVEFDQKIEEADKAHQQKAEQIAKLEQELLRFKEDRERLKEESSKLEQQINQEDRALDALKNEYELSKSLVENLEGFPDAVKFVAKHKQLQANTKLLSDIFACPKDLRSALENLIEPYINYFVVPNREVAMQAIGELEGSQKGRANFFVLDAIDAPDNETPLEGFGQLLSYLEYDEQYEDLAKYLFAKVYITDKASEIPAMDDHSFISRDGRVVQHKRSLHGGSIGLFEGKRVGRAKNLELLDQKIKTGQKEVADLKKTLEEVKNKFEANEGRNPQSDLQGLQRDTDRLESELKALKSRREQVHMLFLQSKEREAERKEKQAELQSVIEGLKPKIADLEKRFEEQKQETEKIKEAFELAREAQREQSNKFNELNINFHKAQNTADAAKREYDYVLKDMAELGRRTEENRKHLERTRHNIAELTKGDTVSDDELLELYAEKENIQKGVSEAEQAYYDQRGAIEKSEGELRELRRKMEVQRDLSSEIERKTNECRLELTAVRERVKVEFNIERIDIDEEDDLESHGDEQSLRTKAKSIKEKMDRIGPINPTAMEAYEEISERFEFITNQKDDLMKAKESLEETISEIDEKAKKQFLETFHAVRDHFVRVFRSLFTDEDEADLILLDPENPLESKIEIMAKPKGKRPQTVNQLSGGEKTLTATSLLFSIYLIKPAPFCIFDEVDAPLDDANIDKFNNIISEFSKESQFIIVTHNKRTMAHTDVIYGVTMAEQGVSRVIPVDLRDLN